MTDKENILSEVQDILVELFQVPKEDITLETNLFADLDLDSQGLIIADGSL